MTVYDLRGTGITWLAIRGDAPLQIKERAGHRSFQMTEGYIREAEALRDGFGTPFPPIPSALWVSDEAILERGEHVAAAPGKGVSARVSDSALKPRRNAGVVRPIQRRGRDSNPGSERLEEGSGGVKSGEGTGVFATREDAAGRAEPKRAAADWALGEAIEVYAAKNPKVLNGTRDEPT